MHEREGRKYYRNRSHKTQAAHHVVAAAPLTLPDFPPRAEAVKTSTTRQRVAAATVLPSMLEIAHNLAHTSRQPINIYDTPETVIMSGGETQRKKEEESYNGKNVGREKESEERNRKRTREEDRTDEDLVLSNAFKCQRKAAREL
eukprot:COSAG02_NODE_210_length_28878_cov_133.787136_8_plen_145_part_00